MPSLAEIRARLEAQETKSQKKGPSSYDNAIYPFWNAPEGTTTVTRFLPDADPLNEWGFWVERNIINLTFNGVKGMPDAKQVTVQVPCIEMFGEKCPILNEVRPWYKDPSLEATANKYWKKRSYLMQGFVRTNHIPDDVTPANPIRRFVVTSQLFPLVKAVLTDPEVEEMPTDYIKGLDFNIRKTLNKGGYPEYITSSWARKESPLTEAEMAAIETYGLFDLKEFLPKRPSESELRIMKDMFEASVDGQAYDPDKWGAYYKPKNVNIPGLNESRPAETETASKPVTTATANTSIPVATQPTQNDDAETPWEGDNAAVEPVVIPAESTSSDKANDILARIRARTQP